MEKDFKLSILLSLSVHLTIFILFSLTARKKVFLTLPVELLFSSPPSSPVQTIQKALTESEIINKAPVKEEVIIPKKKKIQEKKKKIIVEKKKVEIAKPALPVPSKKPAIVPGIPVNPQFTQGRQISVDAVKFPYAYYTNLVVKKIGRYWQWSTEFGNLRTVVYFKIMRDGSISDINVKESSKDNLFDQQAVRSVNLAGPFPPLPDGYSGDSLGIYFEFAFKE